MKTDAPMKVCIYLPKSVFCSELKCEKCGWNPRNKELREKRIEKVLWRKHIEEMIAEAKQTHDESDESESAAEDI